MWNPVVVNDCNYLIKCNESNIINVYLTDFKTIWVEKIPAKDLISRFEDLNPLFVGDDVLYQIKSLVNDVTQDSTVILTNNDSKLTVEIKCKLAEFSIRCKFELSVGDQNMYFNEFTVPLMQSVQYLEIRQKKLFDLLEKKDKEIQEHQLEGGEISRKALITKLFDRNAAMENIPERLFTNVFGKSKLFYDTFSKNYGAVASVSPKIKIEKVDLQPRKKLKKKNL